MGQPHDGRKYSRVYHQAVDDPKFREVWDHDARLALWLRLLVMADEAWPASATLPRSTRPSALSALVSCGLVDLTTGDHYRIHGLDAERSARSNAARNAAAMRWHGDGNADAMPRQDETSREETSRDSQGVSPLDGATRRSLVNPR